MADHDPSDPASHHNEVIIAMSQATAQRDGHDTNTLALPTLAELIPRLRRYAGGVCLSTAVELAAADALEALTADIAALRSDIERTLAAASAEAAEVERLRAENADIKAMISDPQAVHLGMLRGGIAKPSLRNMLHLEGTEALKTWDEAIEARATIERLRERLELPADKGHAYDGISCRDETIRQLDAQLARTHGVIAAAQYVLEAERKVDGPGEDHLSAALDGLEEALRDAPDFTGRADHGWYSTMRREVEAAHADSRGLMLVESLAELRAVWPDPTPEAIAIVADIERVKIRERIREVKESQRARGRYLGGKPPAGASVTKTGTLDMSGAAALRAKVFALAATGLGCRQIAADLTAAGHSLSKSTVANMLRYAPAMEDATP